MSFFLWWENARLNFYVQFSMPVLCNSDFHAQMFTMCIIYVTELMFMMNGNTSVPKSVLHFVSGLRTSTSALDFYKLPCYPLLLLLPNKRSDKWVKQFLIYWNCELREQVIVPSTYVNKPDNNEMRGVEIPSVRGNRWKYPFCHTE